jgi:hypothetical protein
VDFIERIFHLSPDNGNGSLEMTILIAILLPIAIKVLSRLWFQRSNTISQDRSRVLAPSRRPDSSER